MLPNHPLRSVPVAGPSSATEPSSPLKSTDAGSRPSTPVNAEQLGDGFTQREAPETPARAAAAANGIGPITPPMLVKPRLQYEPTPEGSRVARRLVPLNELSGGHQGSGGPDQIRPYLWLGDGSFAQDPIWLASIGIHTIINATREIPCAFPQNYRYVQLPILDQSSTQLSPYWPEVHNVLQAAKQANQRVLLHCQQGISRSAALVMSHLMQAEAITLAQAFAQVQAKRACVEPNPGFLQQLRQLEQQLFGQVVTTQALTFLDAGWHPQDDSRTSRLCTKLEQLLGQAAAHQPLPAQLLPELLSEMSQLPPPEQCEFVVAGLQEMLYSYGKLDSSCQQAHQAFFTLLAQIGTKLPYGPQLLQKALAELFAEEDWRSLLLDVPHASAILAHWPDQLRAQGALPA